MSEDSFTEVTTQSYPRRIGNAVMGIIFAVIFFVGSVVLLFWNEGRAVRQEKTFREGERVAKTISASSVDPSNNQALVCLSATANTDETLNDTEFGVQVKALKLNRDVQMYQWDENKESHGHSNLGGSQTTTTTYHYQTVWSSNLIKSSSFRQPSGHTNGSVRNLSHI